MENMCEGDYNIIWKKKKTKCLFFQIIHEKEKERKSDWH
jgi:hypothetical protein